MAQQQRLPKWVNDHLPPELATSKAFRFQVELPGGQSLDIDLFQDIDIDYDMLEEQMERTPAQYVYWATMFSELKASTYIFERKVKARRGAITQVITDESKKAGVRLTEKQIASMVESDDVLNQLEAKFAAQQRNTNKLYHMVEAIKMKSEMMRSLAGFKRQEKEQVK